MFQKHAVPLLILFAALAMPATLAGEQSVEVSAERVADGLYVLHGGGGNIGVVVGDEGIFLVDDQVAPLTARIRATLDTVGGPGKPVRFVLNTHYHDDHTGGNENLGKAGAIIVAHDNVRALMSTDEFRQYFLDSGGSNLDVALPVVTFNDGVTFHLYGRTLASRHFPHAHTGGDSVMWFREDNAVHMGDIYFQRGYPYIDIEYGGSIDGVIAAVSSVLAEIDDDTVVIPGHGMLSDKAGLQSYHDMLVTLRDRVAKQMAAGKSLEAVLKMKLSADHDERWNWDFIDGESFITTLYRSLADGPKHHPAENHHAVEEH